MEKPWQKTQTRQDEHREEDLLLIIKKHIWHWIQIPELKNLDKFD